LAVAVLDATPFCFRELIYFEREWLLINSLIFVIWWAYLMKIILSVPDEDYSERTWWRLFQKRVVHTKFGIKISWKKSSYLFRFINYVSLRSGFRVVMSVRNSAKQNGSVHLNRQLSVGGLISYLRYLCLLCFSTVRSESKDWKICKKEESWSIVKQAIYLGILKWVH
jgi:hypothetical protein